MTELGDIQESLPIEELDKKHGRLIRRIVKGQIKVIFVQVVSGLSKFVQVSRGTYTAEMFLRALNLLGSLRC